MHRTRIRRTLLATAGAAVCLAAYAAGTTSASPRVHAAGGDLRIGYTTAAVTTLDPAKIATQIGGNFAALALETLVHLDQTGHPVPLLATSWSTSANKLVWTFHLRKGVRFQDGTPFNAAAVKYSLDHAIAPSTAAPLASTLSAIASVTAVNATTVTIRTKQPYAPLLSALSYVPADIVSPTAAARGGVPVGTGAYAISSFDPSGNIAFTANPHYWGAKPKLSSIHVTFYRDESTLVSSLLAGSTDIAWSLSAAQVPVLRSSSSVRLVAHSGYTISYLGFNTQKAPFDRAVVRQAISHAIDLQAILKNVLNGAGFGAAGPMGPTVYGFDPKLKPYSYDPALAKKMLASAGVPNLKISLYIPVDATRERIAAMVQQQLKQAGVSLSIVEEPFGTFLADVAAGKDDMFGLQWSNGTGDADFTFSSFQTGSSANYTKISNPTLDKLIAQQKTEFTPSQRLATIYKTLNVIKELDPWVPVFSVNYIAGVRTAVKGFRIVPSGNFDQMLAGVSLSG